MNKKELKQLADKWFKAISQDSIQKVEEIFSQCSAQEKIDILDIYNDNTSLKAFQYALFRQSLNVISYFLNQPEVDKYLLVKDSTEATVLASLASKGNDKLINQFLNKINIQSIVNESDFMGKTALMNAISNKSIKFNTIKKLVQLGANLHSLDSSNNTITHYLAYTKGRTIKDLHYLIENGVELNGLNQAQKTPLDIAIHMNNTKIFIELLKHIKINLSNLHCLYFAATNNKKEELEILINSGQDITQAFQYAMKNLDNEKYGEIKGWLSSCYEKKQLDNTIKVQGSHTSNHSHQPIKIKL